MSADKTYDPAKEAQLDRTVLELKNLDRKGNEARYLSLWQRMLLLAFDLYDDGSERFIQLLEELFARFDITQGEKFSHYFKFVMSRRKNDQYQDVAGRRAQLESLDQRAKGNDQADGQELSEMVAGPAAEDPALQLDWWAPFLELTSMVLNFAQRHQGQSGNETRRNWYRIFYTEDITQAVKITQLKFLHERDVFAAIKQPYLDYYMVKPCHALGEIAETALKPYCDVVPEETGNTEETPLPIPADVSLCYLRLSEGQTSGVSRSARSNHKKVYDQEKERTRQC